MSLKNFSFLLLQKFQFRARRRDGSWLGSAAGAMGVESGIPSFSHDFLFVLFSLLNHSKTKEKAAVPLAVEPGSPSSIF